MTATNAPLFGRIVSATIFSPTNGSFFGNGLNAITIDDLRMQFKITKELSKHPNDCTLTITNMTPEHRALMQKRPLQVRISAGYAGVSKLLFAGDVTRCVSGQNGGDMETKIQLGDGVRAYREARVSKSYAPGTTIGKMVTDAAGAMNLSPPAIVAAGKEFLQQVSGGHSIIGTAQDEITKLLTKVNMGWSIQDGQLQILRATDTAKNLVRVISEDTGMIGSPQYGSPQADGKPPILSVKALLDAEYAAGAKVKVLSESINGLFRVEKCVFDGDTDGDPFTATLEVKPL